MSPKNLNRSIPEVVTILHREVVSQRRIPVNLSPDDATLFQHELQRTIPQSQLLRFRDVRVNSKGLLFDRWRLLPQSFAYASGMDEWKLRSIARLVATDYLLRDQRVIDSEVLWITDYWSTNYFHWLTDALSRLFVIRDRVNKSPLLLPGPYESSDHVRGTLNAFGVTNIDFIRTNEVVECRNLLMPTHTAPSGHYNDDVIRGVRSVLLKAYDKRESGRVGERIYLSRARAAKRHIVNEDDVRNILSNYGFRTIYPEELSFDEAVSVFSRTHYLASNHGAGLANMLFMPEGGRVLELRYEGDAIRNWFFILSSALNLNYFYQTCEPQNHDADPHYADLVVDVARLKENLNLFVQ
jgi:capsular polysaccharide biosynthesis protein